MLQTGNNPAILKKAYEVSYAVFRVSSNIESSALKEHLEREALSLLDAIAAQKYDQAMVFSQAVGYLVRFGGDTALVNTQNVETIIAELAALNAAVVEMGEPVKRAPEAVPLDDVFTPIAVGRVAEPVDNVDNESGEDKTTRVHEPATPRTMNRQSAIIDRIRQSGNCRFKELQDMFPECSERTLRYDLEALIAQDLVERVGSGGPAVFYKIRQSA